MFTIDPAIERGQVERVRGMRAERDQPAAMRALDALESAARAGAPIIEPTIEAVRAYATVGEISDRLRAVFGVHTASRA